MKAVKADGPQETQTEEISTHVYPENKSCMRGFSSQTCVNARRAGTLALVYRGGVCGPGPCSC